MNLIGQNTQQTINICAKWNNGECHNADCHYAEWWYAHYHAESRSTALFNITIKNAMLNIIALNAEC
jgi:hypothetical protein